MAAIGGLSSSVTNSASSIRGYGGLASGLDRDSLIESMTAGTTSKIYKQQQAKQKLEWQQTALRGITEKLYNFSQKYMSYTSKENLLGSTMFSPSKINTLGKYGSLVSVTGSSAMAGSMSILGVKRLAQNASAISKNPVSKQDLSGVGTELDMTKESKNINVIGGSSLTITYGTKNYTVSLPEEGDYSSAEKIAEALQKAMDEVSVGEDKTLGDVIKASHDGETLVLKTDEKAAAGNTVKLRGDSNDLLYKLGFKGENESLDGMDESKLTITKDGLTGVKITDEMKTDKKKMSEWLAGQEFSFTYNGKTEKIKLGTAEELEKKGLEKSFQEGLDRAFGRGRIRVDITTESDTKQKLSFTTVIPDGDNGNLDDNPVDNSSILAINSASGRNILGGENSVLGIRAGSSNRLNQDSSIMESGLKTMRDDVLGNDPKLVINGVEVKGLSKDDSLREIINKINNTEGIGVKVSYQANTDKFVINSTVDGASGQIDIKGEWGNALFGGKNSENGYVVEEGKDAIVSVKYDGSEPVDIVRGSNTFDLNGMNVTVKGTFGEYNDKGEVTNSDPVTFEAEMDTDKTVETVKGMVDAFNEILELVNKELTTKPNRNYAPLTGPQEDEMSESEIEKWNEKASAGMLFNDNDLRSLASSLRFLVSGDSTLRDMGISVSTNYSDNGKIVFDEEKFRKALEADPEKVREAFTAPAEKDASGNGIKQGGLMVRLQDINNKYAGMTGSTKGILVERAGSPFAPTTIMNNELQKQMDSIDDVIESLQDKLKTEQDRYISQFTSLETLINQMNSQSSWLSSAFGS